jgi:N utilization substance protein B
MAANKKTAPRTLARQCALQALYQWQYTGHSPRLIEEQLFAEEETPDGVDMGYFRALLRGVVEQAETLDKQIAPLLDRPLGQIDPVEHAVLWIGLYELSHNPEIPWRVVINEAVDLTKLFGAEKSHRYINGVLDRLARLKRPGEAQPRAG